MISAVLRAVSDLRGRLRGIGRRAWRGGCGYGTRRISGSFAGEEAVGEILIEEGDFPWLSKRFGTVGTTREHLWSMVKRRVSEGHNALVAEENGSESVRDRQNEIALEPPTIIRTRTGCTGQSRSSGLTPSGKPLVRSPGQRKDKREHLVGASLT